ncbi:hypothetical protein OSTOST_17480 [Ostertagia ostertagi]
MDKHFPNSLVPLLCVGGAYSLSQSHQLASDKFANPDSPAQSCPLFDDAVDFPTGDGRSCMNLHAFVALWVAAILMAVLEAAPKPLGPPNAALPSVSGGIQILCRTLRGRLRQNGRPIILHYSSLSQENRVNSMHPSTMPRPQK